VRRAMRLLRKVNYEQGGLDEYEPADPGPDPAGVVILAPDGTERSGRLGPWSDRDIMKLSEDTQPEMYRIREAPVTFVASRVPPLGYAAFGYRFTDGPSTAAPGAANWIENESLAARFDP